MSLPLIIYLISVASSLKAILVTSTIILLIVCFIGAVAALACWCEAANDDDKKIAKKLFRATIKGLIVAAIIALINATIPNEDAGYKILAAYGVESIAQNEDVQRLGGKSLELLEQSIDKHLSGGEK